MWMLKTQLVFTFFLLSKFQFISYTYSPGQDVKIQYMTAYYLSTHERVNPNLHGLSVGQFFIKKKNCHRGRSPSLPWDFFYIIAQWSCSASGSLWEMSDSIEPETSAPKVWCATNEPPHHQIMLNLKRDLIKNKYYLISLTCGERGAKLKHIR